MEDLFNKYYNPLCNYAVKIIRDDDLAEDLVQNLFIQLWENKKIESIDNPERFLLRCIKFKCIDYLRSKETSKVLNLEEIPDPAIEIQELDEEEIEPLLHYFAAKLPPKTRIVFLLSRKSGMTYKEIAEETNTSVKTVENQMSSALKQMKNLLKTHNFLSVFPFL